MSDDATLLRQYATTRSQLAFTQLVERHLDVVYFAALRRCDGDSHSAEDITQQVFTLLARNADSLAHHTVLTGWLYVTTRNIAANLRRSEHNRRSREAEAIAMNDAQIPDSKATTVDWDRIRPELDGVLDELADRDRNAVLLRFFENRPYAEIGAALKLTEDAARMRVDRALEKLRTILARRGITSTSTALVVALSQHAAEVKPAGLAASVAASALAGSMTAAAGIGVAGSSATLWMLPAGLGTGSLVAIAALSASLIGNAWMWGRANVQQSSPRSPSAITEAKAPLAAPSLTFSDLRREDLSVARDQMRASGASEATIRGVIEGILRRRYREELSVRRSQRLETGWWRERDFTRIVEGPVRMTPADDPILFREMVQAPLDRLLGPDPSELAEINARYEFLTEATRQQLARIEADIASTTSIDVQARYGGNETALQNEKSRLQAGLAAVLAGLPPQQRHEYNLRFGWLTPGLKQRMAVIDGTEDEYRLVFQLLDVHAKARGISGEREARNVAGSRIDQSTADQLVQLLGFERALDYIWSGTYEYPAYARGVREANLPLGIASQIVQLAAKTAEQASLIHFEASRPLDQKRVAFEVLRRNAQVELDALLPPSVQQKFVPRSLAWLADLNEGRYKLITTTLSGQPGSVVTVGGLTIEQPISGRPRPTQVLPSRPAGR